MSELSGKVCLITGATSGIGRETARGLAAAGARLVLPVRNMAKGEETKRDIIATTNNEDIELEKCDLSSFESIGNFCETFRRKHDTLHILINNAGHFNRDRRLSKDRIEEIFAVNFLAPFLMTNNLLDVIKRSAPARIISLTSGLAGGTLDFEDIENKEDFRPMDVYRQSKLEIILFTVELAKRLEGSGVTANCLMPGFVRTGLFRNASAFTRGFLKLMTSSPRKGARTSIYLAVSPDVANISGKCFKKMQVFETTPYSRDEIVAKRLWNVATSYTEKWLKV